jgi:hypothetical protein
LAVPDDRPPGSSAATTGLDEVKVMSGPPPRVEGLGLKYRSFAEFYTAYLAEHARPWTRRLHIAGTLSAIGVLATALVTGVWWLALLAPAVGYGPAWLSHLVVERNRPATFTHPLYSLAADVRMLADTLTGRLPF